MQLHPAFKPLVAAVVGGWLAMGAVTASAQMIPQTADMSVTGTIVPAACSASFESGGVVDFGTVKVVDLPANGYYRLGERNTAFTVTCASDKRVMFSLVDLQSASRVTDTGLIQALGGAGAPTIPFLHGFGTGNANGTTTNLGGYVMATNRGTVDGVDRRIIYSSDGGGEWGAGGGGQEALLPNGKALYSMGVDLNATFARGKVFRFPLRVVAALNLDSRLQVVEDTPLNGQAVFSISYQ